MKYNLEYNIKEHYRNIILDLSNIKFEEDGAIPEDIKIIGRNLLDQCEEDMIDSSVYYQKIRDFSYFLIGVKYYHNSSILPKEYNQILIANNRKDDPEYRQYQDLKKKFER